jgi:nucleoside-diphosphate-sugar epimerase
MTAGYRGAIRLIVISTVFLYGSDQGRILDPSSPIQEAAETAPAADAERAARLFASLGGESVILRLGWAYGRADGITSRVLAAARRGWQLIDGEPGAWLAMIAETDAADAVLPRSRSRRAPTTSPTAARSRSPP